MKRLFFTAGTVLICSVLFAVLFSSVSASYSSTVDGNEYKFLSTGVRGQFIHAVYFNDYSEGTSFSVEEVGQGSRLRLVVDEQKVFEMFITQVVKEKERAFIEYRNVTEGEKYKKTRLNFDVGSSLVLSSEEGEVNVSLEKIEYQKAFFKVTALGDTSQKESSLSNTSSFNTTDTTENTTGTVAGKRNESDEVTTSVNSSSNGSTSDQGSDFSSDSTTGESSTGVFGILSWVLVLFIGIAVFIWMAYYILREEDLDDDDFIHVSEISNNSDSSGGFGKSSDSSAGSDSSDRSKYVEVGKRRKK